jgi:methyl-accepting chemotaxis protein
LIESERIAMSEPTRQHGERLQNIEEAVLFAQHGQDELAEHVRELGRMIERLNARVGRLEDLSRRLDATPAAAPSEAGDEAPREEPGDLNDGRR